MPLMSRDTAVAVLYVRYVSRLLLH